MATCMAAVPILTGALVKKGGGEVIDAVSQGFKDFGGNIGNSMAAFTRAYSTQQLGKKAALAKTDDANQTLKRGYTMIANNPRVMNNLLLSSGANLSVGAAQRMLRNNPTQFAKTVLSGPSNGVSKAASKYYMGLAKAEFVSEMRKKEFTVSLSHKLRRYAQLGVQNKWYNHDWQDRFPDVAIHDLYARRNHMPIAHIGDKFVEDAVTGQLPKKAINAVKGAIGEKRAKKKSGG